MNRCSVFTITDVSKNVLKTLMTFLEGEDIYIMSQLTLCMKLRILKIFKENKHFFVSNRTRLSDNAYAFLTKLQLMKEYQIVLQLQSQDINTLDDDGLPVNCTFFDGRMHSFNENPAFIDSFRKIWYNYGKKSRLNDLPAIVWFNGKMIWMIDDQIHRVGLPAVVNSEEIIYYENGFIHRDGDLPAYLNIDGTRKWYKKGLLYREEMVEVSVNGFLSLYADLSYF